METIENIKETYSFLLQEGYAIVGCGYNFITYKAKITPKIILNFIIDRGHLSLAVSTEYILTNNEYSRYNKYYDFFYILKILNSKIAYEDIHTDMYSLCLEESLIEITEMFNQINIKETTRKLNEVIREYDRERWK